MDKPYSAACDRNRDPILTVLREVMPTPAHVLEIGSGTGQHAVYFGAQLPHLLWQTSDLPHNHSGIVAWLNEASLPNVLPPLTLDAGSRDWPSGPFDAVFTANTCHIMAWSEVQAMFVGIGRVLRQGGLACVYGPFNEGGSFTSDSNARFDASLKAHAAHMGIRDAGAVTQLAEAQGMQWVADHAMPANNRLLIWRKA